MWSLSGEKIKSIDKSETLRRPRRRSSRVDGKYEPQGWTEWTQGFASSAQRCCSSTRPATTTPCRSAGKARETRCTTHVSHNGVHDHGFNNLSTYGNLLRLGREGRFDMCEDEAAFYTLALQVSGAVQAGRWTKTADGGGFIHSFNGPQSLFVDTVRSCRILAVSHLLGHRAAGRAGRSRWICRVGFAST